MEVGLRRSSRLWTDSVVDSPSAPPLKLRNRRRSSIKHLAVFPEQEQPQNLESTTANNEPENPPSALAEQQVDITATVKLGPPPEEYVYGVPLEVPSSPEETKPEIDPLTMLQPLLKPHPGNKLLPEELKQSLNIAQGVKSFLVSRLTSMSNINTMIAAANDAFSTLNFLHDDYESFHSDICKLIRYNRELLVAAEEKSNGSSLEIKAHYEELVIHSNDAEQALLNAEKNLKIACENKMPLIERIAEAREVLRKLEEKVAASVDRVKALEAERDRLSEAFLVADAEMQKYHPLSQEAEMKLTDIQRCHDEAKEGIERIRNKYLITN